MSEIKVEKNQLVGTETLVFSAWEEADGHRSLQFASEGMEGRLGTERLPEELDALEPYSEERLNRVSEWYEDIYERAYKEIISEHPELENVGNRSMGKITVQKSEL